MISIDNAVELMIKTFLGLPKRVTGLQITRAQYQEVSESFPKLLDALEQHASDKLTGINLGEIEWYHRLRNQLYHQGNGLTVERSKIEVYAKLADTLFRNLFGMPLVRESDSKHDLLGEFILAWASFERSVAAKMESKKEGRSLYNPAAMAAELVTDGFLTQRDAEHLDSIRRVRNSVVHGVEDYRKLVKPEMSEFLVRLAEKLAG